MSAPPLDPALLWALRLALAGVWVVAALPKLRDARGFRAAVEGYRLVPGPLAGAVAQGLALGELALALGLLLPASAPAAALGSAALLLLYAAAMAVNLARGRRDLDCGCSLSGAPRPVGEGLLVRNALLAALSLLAALAPGARSLGGIDLLTVGAGAAALLLLQAGAEAALANAPRSAQLRGRA